MTRTFARLQIAACENFAGRQDNPPFLRLSDLAIARAKANGHAEFKRGELATMLGNDGKRHRGVAAAILLAVKYGRLHEKSVSTCLVLPAGLIEPYDPSGRAAKIACATHDGTTTPLYLAACHPNRKHHAHDLCDSCYRAELRNAQRDKREPCWNLK